jgi:hypothetical protein
MNHLLFLTLIHNLFLPHFELTNRQPEIKQIQFPAGTRSPSIEPYKLFNISYNLSTRTHIGLENNKSFRIIRSREHPR